MAEKFLSVKEVSKILQMAEYTVRKQIRVGGLPGIRFGSFYRIPESELIRWINEHKIQSKKGE